MKTKKLLFLAMTLFAGLFVSQAYADVTKTVNGAGGADYLTLKAAFDDINAGTINTGVITLQITGNTTELDIATLNANGVGSALYSSVNIYPTITGLSISGNLSSSLITLNGADYVTIDGRVNATGTVRDLTITNTGGATLTLASTIILTYNAQHNTIKYCIIKGSGTGAVTSGLGTIAFTTASDINNGNGLNTISNNLITNADTAKRPTHSINSLGSTGFPNTNNTITDNEFADFANPLLATNAIYLSALNSAWTISRNSFYESTTFIPTGAVAIMAINVLGGSGYTVNNNFIGGSAKQCGGTAWTKTTAKGNAFMGISLTLTAGGTASEVQGNTIQNFVWNNPVAAYWTGINIAAGNANIGTTAGNTIGASTGTGSITFNYSAIGGAAVNGIAIPGVGTVNMQNNTIGSITTTAPATLAASINGINITGVGSTVTFSNNTINNLLANSTSTTSAQTIFAINNSPNNTVIIDHNTITNLINATTNATATVASSVYAIKSANGAVTITNNTIHDLTIACSNNKALSSAGNALAGMMLYGAAGVRTVSGNTIYNLYDSYPSFAGFICGICFIGTADGNHLADHNFIYNLGVTGTVGGLTPATTATVYGIYGGSNLSTAITTFSNNIITLGGNIAITLQGINDGASTAVGTNKFYFNTVYIGGIPTTGADKSYCLYSVSSSTTRNFRNNIFVNARANGGSASDKHYAAYFGYSTTDLLTLGNNDYYVSGTYSTGSVLGNYAAADVLALPLTTLADAASLNINPLFATAGGTTAVNYYTSYAPLTADPGTGITTDYFVFTRPNTPKMGALENDFTTISSGVWSDASVWTNNVVPASGANVIVNNALTIDQNPSVSSLIIKPGAQLTLNSGQTLTATTFNINSNATNGTGTFVDLNPTEGLTSGTASVQQYLTSGRNWYISSPVTSANGSVITGTAGNTLVTRQEDNNTWPAASSFAVGKGYIAVIGAANGGTYTFSGTLNTGDKSISLSRTATVTKEGFNLVGNPYPSYVSWMASIDVANTGTSNLLTTMWYRTQNNASTPAYVFDTFNETANIGTNNNLAGAVTGMIPPMQAFWVRVVPGQTSGTLAFTNAMRSHEAGTNRLKAPAVANTTQQVLRLQVSNGINIDETVVYFNPNASDGYDNYDSPKMSNANAAIPEIYTMAGTEQLVINGLNTLIPDEELVLGFTPGQSSTFTIKASEISNFDADTKIVLKDNLLNSEQELTVGSDYSFTSDATPTNTRFTLIFRSAGIATALNTGTNDQNVLVYKNANNQITVNCIGDLNNESSVVVYNAVGQKLLAKQLTSSTTVLNTPLTSGVYMVTVTNAGKSVTKKVILD